MEGSTSSMILPDRWWKCSRKRKYAAKAAAKRAALAYVRYFGLADLEVTAYRCPYDHDHYHIGHTPGMNL